MWGHLWFRKFSITEVHFKSCIARGHKSILFQGATPTGGVKSNWSNITRLLSQCMLLGKFKSIALRVGVKALCQAGLAFSRLLPIGPRAEGDPALRLLAYANSHFQSKLLVQCRRGINSIFKREARCQRKPKWTAWFLMLLNSIIRSSIVTMVTVFR